MIYFNDESLKSEFSALGIGKTGKVLKVSGKQTGTSIKSLDKKRNALPTGKRISKYGKVYYEYRKNRTDAEGSKL
jgi:hypothetical protein